MKLKWLLILALAILEGGVRAGENDIPIVTAATLYTHSPAMSSEVVGTVVASRRPTHFRIVDGNSARNFAIDDSGQITITPIGQVNLNGTSDEIDFALTVLASNERGTSNPAIIRLRVYADGSAGASACRPQAPSLLDGYHPMGRNSGRIKGNGFQPPWNVAGVDYCVGLPAVRKLNDPSSDPLPSGCIYSSRLHSVTCDTAGVVVSNFDFALNGGIELVLDAANITVTSNKFDMTTNNLPVLRMNRGADNTVFTHNDITNNGQIDALTSGALFFQSGSGSTPHGAEIEYNYFHDTGADFVSMVAGVLTMKYNYIACDGETLGSHPDFVQHSGGAAATDVVKFNTWVQNCTSTVTSTQGITFGDNGVQTVGTANQFSYNTMVATQSVSARATSYWVRVFLPGLDGEAMVSLQNNYADVTKAFGFAYPGSSNGQTKWWNNINMSAGNKFSDKP